MNRKIQEKISQMNGLFLLVSMIFGLGVLNAQNGSSGNHVFGGSESAAYSEVSLTTTTHWSTERTSPQGYFSAVGVAPYSGADATHNVDGYVKHYATAADQGYVYPVGTGTELRKLTIGGTIPADAEIATAWIAGDPTTVTDPTE